MAAPFYSTNNVREFLVSPHTQQHLLLSGFGDYIHPVVIKWCLMMVLICISLIAADIEHLFYAYYGYSNIWNSLDIEIFDLVFN